MCPVLFGQKGLDSKVVIWDRDQTTIVRIGKESGRCSMRFILEIKHLITIFGNSYVPKVIETFWIPRPLRKE